MGKLLNAIRIVYTSVSIVALMILFKYTAKLTDLNIKDVNEGMMPTFPWIFVILADLIPVIIILGNIGMWKYRKEKNNKKVIIALITPIAYIAIMTAYFLYLILG